VQRNDDLHQVKLDKYPYSAAEIWLVSGTMCGVFNKKKFTQKIHDTRWELI
jgi:hypothetical protein